MLHDYYMALKTYRLLSVDSHHFRYCLISVGKIISRSKSHSLPKSVPALVCGKYHQSRLVYPQSLESFQCRVYKFPGYDLVSMIGVYGGMVDIPAPPVVSRQYSADYFIVGFGDKAGRGISREKS